LAIKKTQCSDYNEPDSSLLFVTLRMTSGGWYLGRASGSVLPEALPSVLPNNACHSERSEESVSWIK